MDRTLYRILREGIDNLGSTIPIMVPNYHLMVDVADAVALRLGQRTAPAGWAFSRSSAHQRHPR